MHTIGVTVDYRFHLKLNSKIIHCKNVLSFLIKLQLIPQKRILSDLPTFIRVQESRSPSLEAISPSINFLFYFVFILIQEFFSLQGRTSKGVVVLYLSKADLNMIFICLQKSVFLYRYSTVKIKCFFIFSKKLQ